MKGEEKKRRKEQPTKEYRKIYVWMQQNWTSDISEMAIGNFGLLSKFISFAISHVKKYLFSNTSRKHATTKLSFIFDTIRLNESEIRRFSFQK